VSSAKQWQGGALHVARYPVALAGLLLVGSALGLSVVVVERIRAVGSSLPRDGARGVVVLAMLVLLPLTEAAGTGNAILRMAFNGLALWAAVLIAVVTGIERAAPVARLLGKAALAATVGLATIISATASWAFPYRSPGHDVTSEATSLPALRGLTLEPATAGQFDRLYAALAPYRSDVARPIMGFDEVPGLVLALDGRSVGEAWYSHVDRGRTMAGIAAACAAGPPRSWAGQLPLLLVTARLTTGDVAALRACHIGFANDYRRLALVGGLPRVSVYVPTTVAAR
jgi:hypothetical protein